MSEYIPPYAFSVAGRSDSRVYREYLQQKSFVKDVAGSTAEVQYAISTSARELIGTIEQLQEQGFSIARAVDSRLADIADGAQEGFEMVSYRLDNISAGIGGLTAKCDWGFSAMIAGLGRVNDSLQELIGLAKTPAQVWSYNQFEIARDALRRELYPEALEALDRAINGHGSNIGYKIDYRFHFTRGMLHLGDWQNTDAGILDLGKAEDCLKTAARYARKDFPDEAVAALTAASWAAYCQGNLEAARAYAEEAVTRPLRRLLMRLLLQASRRREGEGMEANQTLPVQAEADGGAFFQCAKVMMSQSAPDTAIPFLCWAIQIDRNFAIKAASDPDFLMHKLHLDGLLDSLRKEGKLRWKSAEKAAESAMTRMEPRRNHKGNFASAEGHLISANKWMATGRETASTNTFFGYLDAVLAVQKVEPIVQTAIQCARGARQTQLQSELENIRLPEIPKLAQTGFEREIESRIVEKHGEAIGACQFATGAVRNAQSLADFDSASEHIEKARNLRILVLEECRAYAANMEKKAQHDRSVSRVARWGIGAFAGLILGFIASPIGIAIFCDSTIFDHLYFGAARAAREHRKAVVRGCCAALFIISGAIVGELAWREKYSRPS